MNNNKINIITISTNTETSVSHPLSQDYIYNQLTRKLANGLIDSPTAPLHKITKEIYNDIYKGTVLEHDIHINLISDEDIKRIKWMESVLEQHGIVKLYNK